MDKIYLKKQNKNNSRIIYAYFQNINKNSNIFTEHYQFSYIAN